MACVIPSHDLEGRDVQATVNAIESDPNALRGEHGRILLSMVASGGLVEHAVIPLPNSYLVRFIRISQGRRLFECVVTGGQGNGS
jgi:hypothetical protein